jgi:predicted transcriptional regulator
MYTTDGELLATGAIETASERRLDLYRKDMAYLRDAFGGVVVAAELVALWLGFGTASAEVAQVIVAASFGGAMFLPFSYFARKARLARRDLKKLRQARRSGEILRPG